ncbi:MAG: carboxypeptidase regulatory-like domain-containing protein [Acidobacteria bacterium]|nr:carboxypeptidase regulatory-like domain-containing protein [Acidobacteriota bacterium]
MTSMSLLRKIFAISAIACMVSALLIPATGQRIVRTRVKEDTAKASTPAPSAPAAAFIAGDVVVYRVGDTSAALSSAAAPAFLDEYTPAGALVQTIALPTAVSGSNRICTNAGSATSEEHMRLSTNTQFLVWGCYDAAVATATVASGAANRVIGRAGSNAVVDTSTFMTDGTGNIRSVASTNGTDFWVATSSSGTRFTTYGSTTTSTAVAGTPSNVRVMGIFAGQLYESSAVAPNIGVNTVGTGLPTTTGQTVTALNGGPGNTGTGPSPYSFAFLNANTLYVADDRATASGGGIEKWTLNAGTWTLATTFNGGLTSGVRSLTLRPNSLGQAVIFATTAEATTRLVTLVDDGLTTNFTALASAPAGANPTAFRSVAFAPLTPTAAGVTVSGRVMDSLGAGVRNARVTLQDQGGNVRSAVTNAFGYYTFQDVQSGGTYIVGAAARGYAFNQRVVQTFDALTDVNFTPNQ